MQQHSFDQRSVVAPAVLGLLLIAVGAVVLVARQAGFDLFGSIGSWGWPLFIIVPGLVLLVASLVPAPPAGIGFAIAGSIVTTVGSLLLYQSRTGNWESWAYAWALIPAAAGVALIVYGLYARRPSMVRGGSWMAGIAAVLFATGAWFFGGIFAGELRPDATDWWPIVVVAVGAVLVLRAVLLAGAPHDVDASKEIGRPTDPA
jgi:cell wall-active antibiotic response 4TMS protein YvqF